jgi:hypothetical protein
LVSDEYGEVMVMVMMMRVRFVVQIGGQLGACGVWVQWVVQKQQG